MQHAGSVRTQAAWLHRCHFSFRQFFSALAHYFLTSRTWLLNPLLIPSPVHPFTPSPVHSFTYIVPYKYRNGKRKGEFTVVVLAGNEQGMVAS